jgi:hypothetical protein
MREIKNSFFYNERKRKIGGRLCFVKDKRMHMPKMPKQNNLVKPQKRLGKKTDVWLVEVVTKVLETLVSLRSIQLGGRLKLHDRIVGSYANLQVCMYAGGALVGF